ncbi:hypothetical protein PT277_05305 [Acetobacteraceae bacterium ESL0709]|nr:hypothetical protein [Acetobacteraceae bacterium ESL0697]MDF7678113.1 hypothetical protein [Acetobacteraceae bacterium ESL0709]
MKAFSMPGTFRVIRIFGLLAAMFVSPVLQAAEWTDPEEGPIAKRAYQDFKKAYMKNGSYSVASQVIDCYYQNIKSLMALKDDRTLEERIRNSPELKSCYLEDFAAIDIFQGTLDCVKKRDSEYFSYGQTTDDRQTFYRDLLFKEDSDDDNFLVESFPLQLKKFLPCLKSYYGPH